MDETNNFNLVVYGIDAGADYGWIRLECHPGDIDNYMPELKCYSSNCFDPVSKNSNCVCRRHSTFLRDQVSDVVCSNKPFIAGRRHREYKYIGKKRTLIHEIDDTTDLADLIAQDLRDNKRVAIGMEAPMWFPTQRQIRFNDEGSQNAHWWNPAASAATISAIGIGVNLFSILRNFLLEHKIEPTTNLDDWFSSNKFEIFLFEGFINGPKYKLESKQWMNKFNKSIHDQKPPDEHIWDAFLVATAFWEFFMQRQQLNSSNTQKNTQKVIVHSISYNDAVFSHWHNILTKNNILLNPVVHSDCLVLSLTK